MSCIWSKLSESIITATEDTNIGQNTHFNVMTTNKHNKFIKTCKIAVSFKLNNADFPPWLIFNASKSVSTVSAWLCFHLLQHPDIFLIKLVFFHSDLILKLPITFFPEPLTFSWNLCSQAFKQSFQIRGAYPGWSKRNNCFLQKVKIWF